MKPVPGPEPVARRELPRAQDRLSFLYLEHCVVNRDQNALTCVTPQGVAHVPAAQLGAVLFGPGTNVSHQAMMLISESGASCVWVGEQGVRCYASARPLSGHTKLLQAQAAAVSSTKTRLAVARRMYGMRFPDEPCEAMTMQQLRGYEGARVRNAYREAADRFGVRWDRRSYKPGNLSASDPANIALTSANACLYGLVHSVIVALGCSPGLGFIHVGKDLSFVYDMADLYKVEVAIPVAFGAVSEADLDDLSAVVRRRMRDAFQESKLVVRCVKDIHSVLGMDEEEHYDWDVLELWDEMGDAVPSGRSWGESLSW